jgi:hypothetical protein
MDSSTIVNAGLRTAQRPPADNRQDLRLVSYRNGSMERAASRDVVNLRDEPRELKIAFRLPASAG